MTKQETCTYLRNHGIAFEVTEHSAVYNMAECAALALLYPEDDAKNLFARDDKKRQYFLIPVRGDRRVDLKQFRCAHGTSPGLRLRRRAASVCLTPGSVTPLGLLQDPAHQVQSFLDADFLTPLGRIGIHSNDNTAAAWLQAEALLGLLRDFGTPVEVVNFSAPAAE